MSKENKAIVAATIAAFIILVVMLLTTSCKTIVETIEVEKVVEYHHRDTTIVTEADSASMLALLECDSNYNVVMNDLSIANGKRLEMEAKLNKVNNKKVALNVDCHEDSLQHHIEWLEQKLSEKKTGTLIKEVEVEKEIIRNSHFARFAIWHTIGTWAILLGELAVWLFKKFYLRR